MPRKPWGEPLVYDVHVPVHRFIYLFRRAFFENNTCYKMMPNSGKIVAFDTQLLVSSPSCAYLTSLRKTCYCIVFCSCLPLLTINLREYFGRQCGNWGDI